MNAAFARRRVTKQQLQLQLIRYNGPIKIGHHHRQQQFFFEKCRRLSYSSFSSTTTTTTKTKKPTIAPSTSASVAASSLFTKYASLTPTTTTTTLPCKSPLPPSSPVSQQLNAPSSSGRDDDALARYPNLKSAGGILRGADYAGTITFALTGTITAAQSGLDVFGSAMVGVITSVGGGTIRDTVFLNRKPFWTEETEYIWMGLFTGLATFFVWPKFVLEWQQEKQQQQQRKEDKQRASKSDDNNYDTDTDTDTNGAAVYYDTVNGVLDTLDAIGLSAFAIIGAQNGIRAGMPMLVSAICGMATATFGGLIRDVLCGRPVRIVHSTTEVYAPPALAGATVYLTSKRMGGSPATRLGLAIATCMGSRYIAVRNDLKLHTWDTAHDNLGVTVRKRPTTNKNYMNK